MTAYPALSRASRRAAQTQTLGEGAAPAPRSAVRPSDASKLSSRVEQQVAPVETRLIRHYTRCTAQRTHLEQAAAKRILNATDLSSAIRLSTSVIADIETDDIETAIHATGQDNAPRLRQFRDVTVRKAAEALPRIAEQLASQIPQADEVEGAVEAQGEVQVEVEGDAVSAVSVEVTVASPQPSFASAIPVPASLSSIPAPASFPSQELPIYIMPELPAYTMAAVDSQSAPALSAAEAPAPSEADQRNARRYNLQGNVRTQRSGYQIRGLARDPRPVAAAPQSVSVVALPEVPVSAHQSEIQDDARSQRSDADSQASRTNKLSFSYIGRRAAPKKAQPAEKPVARSVSQSAAKPAPRSSRAFTFLHNPSPASAPASASEAQGAGEKDAPAPAKASSRRADRKVSIVKVDDKDKAEQSSKLRRRRAETADDSGSDSEATKKEKASRRGKVSVTKVEPRKSASAKKEGEAAPKKPAEREPVVPVKRERAPQERRSRVVTFQVPVKRESA